MRKLLCVILILCMAIGQIVTPAHAAEKFVYSESDAEAVLRKMECYDVAGESFEMRTLFNADDEPAFLLGLSEKGYVIIGSEDYMFHEGGEGNPFRGFEQSKLYYGGPLCYFVDDGETYYDIFRGEHTSEMREVRPNPDAVMQQKLQSVLDSPRSTTKVLPFDMAYIRKRAFGHNSLGTCTAVAFGQALYYLDAVYDDDCVPAGFESELRTINPEYDTDYAKAEAMHQYLSKSQQNGGCGMGVACYGSSTIAPFNTYCSNMVPASQCNVSMTYTLSLGITAAKQHLDQNLPLVITTGIGNPDTPYNTHSMLVYGYKVENGLTSYLVHNGWYCQGTDQSTYVNGFHVQNQYWLSSVYALMFYRFYVDPNYGEE